MRVVGIGKVAVPVERIVGGVVDARVGPFAAEAHVERGDRQEVEERRVVGTGAQRVDWKVLPPLDRIPFLAGLRLIERAVDRLLAIVGVLEHYVDDPTLPGGCPILNTAIEADDAYPPLRERAKAAMTDWHKLIGSTVKAGVQRGELRPEADPRVVASVLTAGMEGALMLSKLYNDPIYMRRTADHLCAYIRSLVLN